MKNLCLVIFFFGLGVCNSLNAGSNPWKHLSSDRQLDSLTAYVQKFSEKNHDSTIAYAQWLRKVAHETKNDEAMVFAIIELAWAHKKKDNLDQSILYYFDLERINKQLGDIGGQATAYFNIGQIFAKVYEYDKALNYLERAKDFYEEAKQYGKVSKALYEIATRYIEKKQPDIATKRLKQALEVCQDEMDAHRSMIYNRLGWAAKDQHNYVLARDYYYKSITVLNKPEDYDKKRAIAFNNIGETHLLEGRRDSAAYYFDKAIKIKNNLGNHESSLETLTQLARLAYEYDQIEMARKYLDQGIANMNLAKPSQKLVEALELITMIANDPKYESPIPYKDVTYYMNLQQQQLSALQDLKDQLNKTTGRYHVQAGISQDKFEQERRTLYASINKQNYWKYGLSGASVVLSFLVVFGFFRVRREKREKQTVLQDKDAFVTEQVKNYDQRILQMLIVKAEYEEMKTRLKKDFGLDDEDFST